MLSNNVSLLQDPHASCIKMSAFPSALCSFHPFSLCTFSYLVSAPSPSQPPQPSTPHTGQIRRHPLESPYNTNCSVLLPHYAAQGASLTPSKSTADAFSSDSRDGEWLSCQKSSHGVNPSTLSMPPQPQWAKQLVSHAQEEGGRGG